MVHIHVPLARYLPPVFSAWPIPTCPSGPVSDAPFPVKTFLKAPGQKQCPCFCTLVILSPLLARSAGYFSPGRPAHWGVFCTALTRGDMSVPSSLLPAEKTGPNRLRSSCWVIAGFGRQDRKGNHPLGALRISLSLHWVHQICVRTFSYFPISLRTDTICV